MRHVHSTQGMVIHQYHFSVSPGDAITNQMFFIYRSLRQAGIESRIYADHIRGGLSKWVNRFNEAELWNCDLLLLHHSHGNPQLQKLLGIEVPKALIYHNITPEHFFRHDPHMWNLCRIGRSQLKLIRQAVSTTFVDSRFNGRELKDLGFTDPIHFPLFDIGVMMAEVSNSQPRREKGKIKLLFVGKIAPHKNQIALLRTLSYLPPEYELTLVGSADPIYLDYVKLTARALGVHSRVQILGKVPEKDLKRAYQESWAFLSTSLHEGFGVPLIEAMVHQLPVFAINSGAVAETLDDAGVLFNTEKPWELAAVLKTFLAHPEAIKAAIARQNQRLEALRAGESQERVQTICRDLVHHLRVVPECDWKKEAANIARQLET
ncbi:MAG: glycosyltransferase [Deltaproteobacteria bacterium]|nr:glycosyltransferase [Deltaproteobacteria bacterium]MBI3295154.1 glycosyltransferase [Deltaproteobacteria bacterium]